MLAHQCLSDFAVCSATAWLIVGVKYNTMGTLKQKNLLNNSNVSLVTRHTTSLYPVMEVNFFAAVKYFDANNANIANFVLNAKNSIILIAYFVMKIAYHEMLIHW